MTQAPTYQLDKSSVYFVQTCPKFGIIQLSWAYAHKNVNGKVNLANMHHLILAPGCNMVNS